MTTRNCRSTNFLSSNCRRPFSGVPITTITSHNNSIPTLSHKKQPRSFYGSGPKNSFTYPSRLTPQLHTIDSSSSQPLTVHGRIGFSPVLFLIDTGSSLTLINHHLFNKLDPRLTASRRRPPPSLSLRLANNSTVSIQWLLRLPLTFAGNTCWQTVYVVRDLWRSCIIGNNFIRAHNLHFDGGKQRIFFPTPWTPRSTPRPTSSASLYSHQPSLNYRCTSPYPRPSLSNYRRAYHTLWHLLI